MFCAAVLSLACGKEGPIVVLPPPTPARLGDVYTGTASWYGRPYHGRRTSSGEVYDMHGLTAAHLSLPFDTVLRVTNPANGRSVDVRVNDRGPFVDGRFLDLSRAAAEAIGMIGPGTAKVLAEVVETPSGTRAQAAARGAASPATAGGVEAPSRSRPAPVAGVWSVQAGSFRIENNALRLLERLESAGFAAAIRPVTAESEVFYRVTAGDFGDVVEAQRHLQVVRAAGFDGIVLRKYSD